MKAKSWLSWFITFKALSPLIAAVIVIAMTVSVAYIVSSSVSSLSQRQIQTLSGGEGSISSAASAVLNVFPNSIICKNGKVRFVANLMGSTSSQHGISIALKTSQGEIAHGKNESIILNPGIPQVIEIELDKNLEGEIESIEVCTGYGICYENSVLSGVRCSSSGNYFAKMYGNDEGNVATGFITRTSDGGYFITGAYEPSDRDALILKLDSYGNVEWAKAFNFTGDEELYFADETLDGGIIAIVSYYSSTDDEESFFISKLDNSGNEEWSIVVSCEGGEDFAVKNVVPTNDGGYILTGKIYVPPYNRVFVMKLNSSGYMEWIKGYNISSENDYPWSIIQTQDGGYLVGGFDALGPGKPFLLKLDSLGNVEWVKIVNLNATRFTPLRVQQTNEGNYIVACVDGNSGSLFLLEINSSGNIEWAKNISLFPVIAVYAVLDLSLTNDGDYVLSGAGIDENFEYDGLLFKFDSSGNIQWVKIFDTQKDVNELLYFTEQLSDGSYLTVGVIVTSTSPYKALLLKLDENGNIPGCELLQDVTPTVKPFTPESEIPTVTVFEITPVIVGVSPEVKNLTLNEYTLCESGE